MRFIVASLILVLSNLAFAFWAGGGCGSVCMNQMSYWGRPQFHPPVYMYPYGPAPTPMNFYNLPTSNYWPMMPRWNMPMRPMMGPGYIRGVSSEEKK